jgi:hypothetical protein
LSEERVFLYGLSAGTRKGDAVRQVATSLGIGVSAICEADLALSVGELVGGESTRAATGRDAPCGEAGEAGPAGPGTPASVTAAPDGAGGEFMLMQGFDDERLDAFLAALRQRDASVGCKCTVTPTNLSWTVGDLMRRVAGEHEVMSAYMALYGAYKRAVAAREAAPSSASGHAGVAGDGGGSSGGPRSQPGLEAAIDAAKSLLSDGVQHTVADYREACASLERVCGEGRRE